MFEASCLCRGVRVIHGSLGPGEVRGVGPARRLLWVAFDRQPQMPMWVPALELLEPGAKRKRRAPGRRRLAGKGSRAAEVSSLRAEAEEGEALRPETLRARNAVRRLPRDERLHLLEALRTGVVPAAHAEDLMVGQDGVLDDLLQLVGDSRRSGRGGFRVVLGDYGAGKSLLLEVARQRALEEGFLVARATLGLQEVTPAHPRRLYHELVRTLTYPDVEAGSQGGLEPLLRRLLRQGRAPRRAGEGGFHGYLDPVLWYLGELSRSPGAEEVCQRLLRWVEGHPSEDSVRWNRALQRHRGPYLYALPDWRTFAHVYSYLLGGIACMAREAGWSGLALLVDEAELYASLRPGMQQFAKNMLRCYAVACLGWSGVRFEQGALRPGGQAVHRRVPVLHEPRQPLVTVFVLTPAPGGRAALAECVEPARHERELVRLGPTHCVELVERLAVVYREAHPGVGLRREETLALVEGLRLGMQTDSIPNARAAIRVILEILDVARLCPKRLQELIHDLSKPFSRW